MLTPRSRRWYRSSVRNLVKRPLGEAEALRYACFQRTSLGPVLCCGAGLGSQANARRARDSALLKATMHSAIQTIHFHAFLSKARTGRSGRS